MNSFRVKVFDGRAKYLVAVVALLLVTIMPALASADQVTDRSIQSSSSSVNSTNVTYTVNFNPVKAAGAFVVNFCANTPLLGEACTPPTDFTMAAATATTTNFTDEQAIGTNAMRVTGPITPGTPVSVDITGVTNPSVAGQLYARIVTYDTPANANAYVADSAAEGAGGVQDAGGVALYITPTIGVSGAVLETMTFCVSGQDITAASCGGTITPPTLKLGQDIGDGVFALSTTVSTGSIYTQLSTNAASGAIVRLKSSATNCGGLKLAGSTDPNNCFIAAAQNTDIATGQAKFGVKTATAAGVGTNFNGELRPMGTYNNTTYVLNAATNNSTGVTSTYGDPFLDTHDAPVNNMGMALTFGAAVANDTPAGLYSAELSLIATGKF